MPVNDKYPLEDVLAECRRYVELRRRKVFVEYVMLAGVNDSLEHARALVSVLDRHLFKVNLIPYNPTGMFDGSSRETIAAFKAVLDAARQPSTIRLTRGRDIAAACGQLAAADSSLTERPRFPGHARRPPKSQLPTAFQARVQAVPAARARGLPPQQKHSSYSNESTEQHAAAPQDSHYWHTLAALQTPVPGTRRSPRHHAEPRCLAPAVRLSVDPNSGAWHRPFGLSDRPADFGRDRVASR